MLSRMENSHRGNTDIDDLDFQTVRVTDERGMEKTVKCFVYDKQGNRVIWPTQGK